MIVFQLLLYGLLEVCIIALCVCLVTATYFYFVYGINGEE